MTSDPVYQKHIEEIRRRNLSYFRNSLFYQRLKARFWSEGYRLAKAGLVQFHEANHEASIWLVYPEQAFKVAKSKTGHYSCSCGSFRRFGVCSHIYAVHEEEGEPK